ncbi:MAG: hypothetical protein ACKON9_26585, partial [Planctomycetaceae bacterium]
SDGGWFTGRRTAGSMTITISPGLEAALIERSHGHGVSPHDLAAKWLADIFQNGSTTPEPLDAWERRLVSLGLPCGVGHTHEDLGREKIRD